MKQQMKKLGALLLAMVMVLSMSMPALAASSSDTTGSITISGAIANENYTIYQIFELTYTSDEDGNNTGDSYSYKVVEAWKEFIEEYSIDVVNDGGQVETVYLFDLTDYDYLSPDSPIFTYENDADVVAAFARAALAYAAEEDINESASASFAWSDEYNQYTVNGNAYISNVNDDGGYAYTDMTFYDLDLGWYLVDTSLGSLCMLTSTDPNATVNEKNGTPTVEKWVHENSAADETWTHEDDAMNGESILFEINISNINGAVNLVLHDSMDSELHVADNSNFHLNTILLYTNDDEDTVPINLVEGTDYIITVGECTVEDCTLDNCAFEVHFVRDFDDVDTTGYITLTYYLVLDTDDDSYTDDFDEIDNYAQVTFATSSVSTPAQAETYSFGFEVFKYTGTVYEGQTYQYVITDSATYDINAGGDAYCLAYLDEDTNTVYYAVFDLGDWDTNSDAEFVITDWTEEINLCTTWNEGTEDVTVNLTFYANSMPNENIDNHIVEIMEIEGDSSIDPQEFTGDDNTTIISEGGQPLANAVFVVTNEMGQTAYFLYENNLDIYLFEGWLNVEESLPDDSPYTTSLTSASNGMIYIEGLDIGGYILTEIAAPDGYNKLDNSIYVTIWADYNNDTGECNDYGVTWTLGENGDVESGVVNVENNSGTELPSTGGMGTTIFYILGAILVCGAGVLLITRRRMSREA